MCKVNLHWSVFSILVCVVAVVMVTVGVCTVHWAHTSLPEYDVNAGLFMSCQNRNDTCKYTHTHFHGEDGKSAIMASAVLMMCACIGMWFFFMLIAFYLCGLFDDDSLIAIALMTSYGSGLIAMIATIMFAVNITSLGYSVGWSFFLAVAGLVINVLAGVLMCVGRNASRRKQWTLSDQEKTGRAEPEQGQGRGRGREGGREEVEMSDMARRNAPPWTTGRQAQNVPPPL